MKKIFVALRSSFNFASDPEITIECNPNSITEEKLISYKNLGVSRISLGMQSCNEVVLKNLGRQHNSKDVANALALLSKLDFKNINIDLIYNVPVPKKMANAGMVRDIEAEVNHILLTAPHVTHVSAYSLIPEEGTPLKRKLDFEELYELGDDVAIDEELELQDVLKLHGFKRYEVSNWARPGFECKHNLAYWSGEMEYLGLGLSASGLFKNERYDNTDNMSMYLLNPDKVEKREQRKSKEMINEIIMLGLRTTKGVDLARLEKLGISLRKQKHREILHLTDHNLLKVSAKRIKASDVGFFILNMIIDRLTFDFIEEKI